MLWRRLDSAALSLLLRGRRGAWWRCRGSDVRFGVVWAPPVCAAFAWQACGTWWRCRGSDVCFGVAWAPLLCRCFCVAGVGLGGAAGGLMYALASFGLRRSAAAFAWQACGIWWHCRGSDVCFGVAWTPLLCRCFCVAGVGLGGAAGSLMYALAFCRCFCVAGLGAWHADKSLNSLIVTAAISSV